MKALAYIVQWFHCLIGMFQGCQAVSLRDPDNKAIMLGCTCGRLFWQVPELREDYYHENWDIDYGDIKFDKDFNVVEDEE